MKKIGLITIHDTLNYGSLLQTYLAKLRFGINASYIVPVLFTPSSPLCSCAK